MEYRRLGRTDIEVPQICFGTMTFGEQNDESESHTLLDVALESGVTFLDTSELYPTPSKAETYGRTDQYIGTWLKSRNNRDQIILASKVLGRDNRPWFRDQGAPVRQTKAQIHESIDKSLKRLQTDYIDLFQLHWPDRPMRLFGGLNYTHRDEDSVPIGEILQTLEGLVQEGKIRAIGISNETPWGAMQFLQASEVGGLSRMATIQNAYNLVNRTFEIGLSEIALREDLGLLAYSPMANGFLSGKYQDGARPENARLTRMGKLPRYQTPKAEAAIDQYVALARAHGWDPGQLALRFVDTRPFVTSTIIGATKVEQLQSDIQAFSRPLADDIIEAIDEIHLSIPNPCP